MEFGLTLAGQICTGQVNRRGCSLVEEIACSQRFETPAPSRHLEVDPEVWRNPPQKMEWAMTLCITLR